MGLYFGLRHDNKRGSDKFAGRAMLYVLYILDLGCPGKGPHVPWQRPGYTTTGPLPGITAVDPVNKALLSHQWSFHRATGIWAQCRKSRETQCPHTGPLPSCPASDGILLGRVALIEGVVNALVVKWGVLIEESGR
jgi:hypothetical protein